jgi:hypothetical protein
MAELLDDRTLLAASITGAVALYGSTNVPVEININGSNQASASVNLGASTPISGSLNANITQVSAQGLRTIFPGDFSDFS